MSAFLLKNWVKVLYRVTVWKNLFPGGTLSGKFSMNETCMILVLGENINRQVVSYSQSAVDAFFVDVTQF